jgi:hypothetical protein
MENHCIRLFFIGIFLIPGFSHSALNAQEAVPASGGTITGSGGSVSYTVGQVVYTTITGTGGTVSQGVQQAYAISVISEVPEASDISLDLSVFPNPASDYVRLNTGNIEPRGMTCRLYDTDGKLLRDINITDRLTTIPVDYLLRATYFLRVMKDGREIKVFKIVKD